MVGAHLLTQLPLQGEHPQKGGGHPQMLRIPGGRFRMGSDRHYAEEAPAHRVTVDGLFIDRTPLTNEQFRGTPNRSIPPQVTSDFAVSFAKGEVHD
jgi:hypothetical protein